MNLYLLVEGRRTEPQVYSAWVQHTFPALRRVWTIADVDRDSFYIISGNGQPAYLHMIPKALRDIAFHPVVDWFFVCIDSEDRSYQEKLAEVSSVVDEAVRASGVRRVAPNLRIEVVIQNCCIETWMLGHARMLKRNPQSENLRKWKQFHDVSVSDPEHMGCFEGYITRATFHEAYLKEMFRERGHRCSKTRPGIVLERHYLDALRHRCDTTGHLASLNTRLTTWSRVPEEIPR